MFDFSAGYFCLLLAFSIPWICLADQTSASTPQQALERLIQGNKRYTMDRLEHPNRNQDRREAVTTKQMPFASIVGCSDSRVAPEIIFDQGIGDLFVVRVAGNVVGPIELDSLDYSVEALHSSLILVLGHENCGAVSAVLSGQGHDIESIADRIEPAIRKVKSQPGNILENAIKANVMNVVNQIRQAALLANRIKDQKLDVIGGYYHLETGEVEFLAAIPNVVTFPPK